MATESATQQTASASGTGNVVVQIVGDGNRVEAAHPHLTLTRYLGRRQIHKDLDRLSPYTRSTPLIGRDREMASLWAFLDDPRPLSARVLIGGAGSGKTRLALELCEQAHVKGWSAGFVGRHELKRFFAQQNLSAWGWSKPTLMVVDYAAEHAELLGQWLDELADRLVPDGTPPLRLLLLERHASTEAGWWFTVFASGGYGASNKRELLDPPEPVPVQPLAQGDDRLALLKEVLTRISGDAGGPALDDEALGKRLMEQEWGGDPLFLMMAALQASRVGVQALSLGRLDLAYGLADRECNRLQQLAKARSLDPVLVTHLAACVTLAQGLNRGEFESFAVREKVAVYRPGGGDAAALADLLQEALPRAEGIAPVLPDLIGEALVLRTLGRTTESGAATVLRCHEIFGHRVADSIIRSAQDFASQSALPLLWLNAIFQAISDDENALAALDSSLPLLSVALGDFNLQVVQQLYVLRMRRDDLPMKERAAILLQLAVAQIYAGQRESALRSAWDAVALYRKLVEQRLDVFGPNLAGSLSNLAGILSELGRSEEAIEAVQEAVDIFRKLAKQRPHVYQSDLAMSLNNFANRLSEVGWKGLALEPACEAMRLYRKLSGKRSKTFGGELAGSLMNLGSRLSEVGRHEKALKAALKAEKLYREFVLQRPDTFRPDLARTLNNLAKIFGEVGQHEKSLDVSGEAVELYRDLTKQRSNVFLPGLAAALVNFTAALGELNRYDEALEAAMEAVDAHRKLAGQQANAFLPDLAMSLNNLASILSELKQYEKALGVVCEAVDLYRELSLQRADIFRFGLAMSISNLAAVLNDLGFYDKGVGAAQEAVELYRQLIRQQPDVFRCDLVRSLIILALCIQNIGEPRSAVPLMHEAITTLNPVFLRYPRAHMSQMRTMLVDYLRLCKSTRREPDVQLLESLLPYLSRKD